jgi:putative ABC transport system permease protein
MHTMTGNRTDQHRGSGARAFFFAYLRGELRRRWRQSLLMAAGLAVGVGLVVTVTAAAAGVSDAQAAVLHSLYGIGTDVTVTMAPPRSAGSGNRLVSPGKTPQHMDDLGVASGLGVLPAAAAGRVSRLKDVAAAAGGLTLTDTVFNVPSAAQAAKTGLTRPVSFTVDGVDIAHLSLGPISSGTIVSGRAFAARDTTSDVAVADARYARAHRIPIGSPVTIAGRAFTVIGLIGQAQGAPDVYIPLARAQAIAQFEGTSGVTGKISTIYVAAASSADVPAVRAEITRILPAATVTSSGDLASKVSGSLASAASLATDLGRWLAVAVLLGGFAGASVLTTAAVARRVRELGTLKALGWRSRRIIAQILAEAAVTGVAGAAIGIAIGFGGAALIAGLSPALSATVAANPGSAPAQGVTISGGALHHLSLPGATRTVAVHMSAPVHPALLGLAVLLAIGGALIAGSFGAWRATRLSPVQALAQLA